jgi:glycosyltransferase involved in cell wall biosynthesis
VFRAVVVIPVYNHQHAIGTVLAQVLALHVHAILVDDGSNDECAKVLDALAQANPQQVVLLRLAQNGGKGAAVLAGCEKALALGYSHALQIDADGQHQVADLPRFLGTAAEHPLAVIVGYPVYDDSVPRVRLYARYLTHVWVWINTLSLEIRDSMCGFRVYPLAPLITLAGQCKIGRRMNFDTDVLVRLHWAGLPMVNLPTRVSYPLDGVSHFRLWLDNALITRMHATLFCGMLLRLPKLLARKWRTRRMP